MAKSRFDTTSIGRLPSGAWLWDEGIGYRRHGIGDGGTWYIKYRAADSGGRARRNDAADAAGERAPPQLPQSLAGRGRAHGAQGRHLRRLLPSPRQG